MKILDHIQIYESKDDDGFIVLHPTKEDLVMKLNEIIDVLEEMRARQDIYARREELDQLVADTNTTATHIQNGLASVNESVESLRGVLDRAVYSTASDIHYDPATYTLSSNAVNVVSAITNATNVSIARGDTWV